MPIHVFYWIVASAFVGYAVGRFWDELKAWASQALNVMLNGINTTIEVWSDGLVSVVEKGVRILVKKVVVYIQNAVTKQTRTVYQEQPISYSEIPEKIKAQLQKRSEVKLLELETQS